MLKIDRFTISLAGFALVGLLLAAPASAATDVKCRNDWAKAFQPTLDNITGNMKELFSIGAVFILIAVLVLLAFLHATRHRSILIASIGMLFLVAIALTVGPTILGTFIGPVCGG